jgi:16S rRNA C1402 (ribose-2'-O) methylase RsmI
MTVGTQVKQVLAGLKSAQASFEGFALATDNQNAKQLYQQAAQQAQAILDSIEPRLQEIQAEEPQYNQ